MPGKQGYRWFRSEWQPNHRQRQVLDALADGATNAEIATLLGITPDGAKWHIGELLIRSGLADRTALAEWWRAQGGRSQTHAMAALVLPSWFQRPAMFAISAGMLGALGAIALVVFGGGGPEKDQHLQPPPPDSVSSPRRAEPVAWQGAAPPADCPVSNMWRVDEVVADLLGGAVALGDGRAVWLSGAPVQTWAGADYPRPVRWIIDASVTEPVVVTGHRLDGNMAAQFVTTGARGSVDALVLETPHNYFHQAYVVTPTAGCWQFDVQWGEEQSSITFYLPDVSVPDSCPVSSSSIVSASIAPGIGADGVWLISAPIGTAAGSDVPLKTIWWIDDSVTGTVRITGRQLDGEGVVRFHYGEVAGFEEVPPGTDPASVDAVNQRNRQRVLDQRQPEVVFEPPHGLPPYRTGYMFYGGPGCWRFTIETEQGQSEITLYVYEYQP